jgi:hypothetical protein
VLPRRDRAGEREEEQLGIEVVAQDGVPEAALLQGLLGGVVVGDDGDDRRRAGLGSRGVDDVLHARLRRGVHRALVLGEATARAVQGVGADDQRPRRAGERVREGAGHLEIRAAHLHAAGAEIGDLVRIAGGGDERPGALREQEVEDAAPELTAGAGDEERLGHG